MFLTRYTKAATNSLMWSEWMHFVISETYVTSIELEGSINE